MNADVTPRYSTIPSFSFLYGGVPSAELLTKWIYKANPTYSPDVFLEQHSWTDPQSGLKVTLELRRFPDFSSEASSAHDWVLSFENQGESDTQILETILPLDATIPITPAERVRLHYAYGSACRKDDFLPQVEELQPGNRKVLAPVGGYSSEGRLPFMNLQWRGGGLILAVGWSGQWTSGFERDENSIHLFAGMEHTHLLLHPGEKIRTPRILFLPWEGEDMEDGQNFLRRLLLAHYLPKLDGGQILPPLATCLQPYYYLTDQAGESYEMQALAKGADLGVEVHWVDALWYGGKEIWWEEVGTWEVNKERFPNGLKPISDAAHQAGMKFLLWFEPERARLRSRLAREHPEFFLRTPGDPDNLLLNLGDSAVLEYITNLISICIEEFGVDIYRQDFNFEAALPFWQTADPPDRQGMTEIQHVQGLYAFWDALLARHPGLWIDNCASGGRRIDLELLSRSLPLWPSDFFDVGGMTYGLGLHVGDQCINAGLARWVPLFGGAVINFTPYSTRSQLIGGFSICYHIERDDFPSDDVPIVVSFNEVLARGKVLMDDDFPMEQACQAIAEWKSVRPFFLGDFHLLLPLTVSDHDWCAWQFHREDMEAGIAAIFRRHQSPFPSMNVSLKKIDPKAVYTVSISPGYTAEPEQEVDGKTLLNLSLSVPEKPGSLLVRYRKVL